jgi:hypothetical protein
MEISLVLSNDSGSFQTILGQFISSESKSAIASAAAAAQSASDSATSASTSSTWASNASNSATASANSATASATSATASANSATASANSQAAAAISETNAGTSASNANTSSLNSNSSAAASLTSANAAAVSATLAQNWASQGSGTVDGVNYSAKYYAGVAQAAAASVSLPIPVSSGGTGATTAAAARTALGVPGLTGANSYTGTPTYAYSAPTVVLNDTSTANGALITYQNNGVNAWTVGKGAAGNYYINRYVLGTLTDTPIAINVSNGVVTFSATPIAPTPALGDNSTNQATTAFVVRAMAPFTGRNRLINGDMRIQQRAALPLPAGGNGYGGADRWKGQNATGSGAVLTLQAATTVGMNGVSESFQQIYVNTVASNIASNIILAPFYQFIEGFNCYDLIGSQVTVSFVCRGGVAGNYAVSLRDGVQAYSCVKTFSYTPAATPQYVTLTFPAIPSAATVPVSNAAGLLLCIGALNTGTYQTSTPDVWQAGNYLTVPGLANWAAVANNTFNITDVQLEQGSIATPFERLTLASQYAACQRYYQTGNYFGQNSTAGTFGGSIFFKSNMRVAPTLALSIASSSGITTNPAAVGTYSDSIAWNATAGASGGYLFGGFTANSDF